jgi:hypothetical protein
MKAKMIIDSRCYEAIKLLPMKAQNEVYACIMEYTLYGTEPTSLSRYAHALWLLIKATIDDAETTANSTANSCDNCAKNEEVSNSDTQPTTDSKSVNSTEKEEEKLASNVHKDETSSAVDTPVCTPPCAPACTPTPVSACAPVPVCTPVHTSEEIIPAVPAPNQPTPPDSNQAALPASNQATSEKEKEREETKKERTKERSKEAEQNKENLLQKKNSSSFSNKVELSLPRAIAFEVDRQLDRKLRNSPEVKAARLLKAKEACQKRKEAFYQSLNPYVERYGIFMLREFAAYWTELSQSGTKMRFEMTKTWTLEQRLRRWEYNDFKFGNKSADGTYTFINDKGRQVEVVNG